MLRKISTAIVASAATLLLAGGMASAADEVYLDTESGLPFVDVTPNAPEAPEGMAPVGATGIEAPGGAVSSDQNEPAALGAPGQEAPAESAFPNQDESRD